MANDNERRFERLYSEHFDRVGSYLLSRADRAVAEDALARTFEIAWRRIADVPDESLPWLLGVARKVLAELRRAQGRRDALIERIAASVEENDEEVAPEVPVVSPRATPQARPPCHVPAARPRSPGPSPVAQPRPHNPSTAVIEEAT